MRLFEDWNIIYLWTFIDNC